MHPINRLANTSALSVLLMVLTGAGLISGNAEAGQRVRIEFAGDDPGGGGVIDSGDSWVTPAQPPQAADCGLASTLPTSCGVQFTSNASVAIKLGFSVKIGTVSYDSLFINKNGVVTFGSALTSNFAAAATMTQLQAVITANGTVTRPFIAPFYANLTIPSVLFTDFVPFGGGASYFRASGDPLPPFSAAQRVPAFAVTWFDSDFNNNPRIATQLVLYTAGANGDFYLTLRYGEADTDQFTRLAGGSLVTGLSTDAFQLTNPLGGLAASFNNYFFVFRNGHLVPSLDADTDGILDGVDNCRLIANPTQLDSNGDGYGNLCDADLNNSGVVTTADYGILRTVLGQAASASAAAAAADLNGSGTVTTADFGLLRAVLGTAPGPSGFKP
jgi:hypothetical protein